MSSLPLLARTARTYRTSVRGVGVHVTHAVTRCRSSQSLPERWLVNEMGKADHPSLHKPQDNAPRVLKGFITPQADGTFRSYLYRADGSLRVADGTLPPYKDHGTYQQAEGQIDKAVAAIADTYGKQHILKRVTITYELVEEDDSLDDPSD